MLSAKDTTLRADRAYIQLLEAASTWPTKYVFTRTNPVNPRALAMWAEVPGVPAAAVDTYNRLLPISFRSQVRSAENKPQTALYGTAPFLGRGQLAYTNTSSLLQQGQFVPGRGSRTVTEIDMRRSDFVTIPTSLSSLPFEARLGELTRFAPTYSQPHD